MKIKLVLLDRDREYLNRLMSVFSHKYSAKLELYLFTDMGMALETLKTIKADVFLVNEEFEVDEKKLSQNCGFAYLCENSNVDSIREHRAVSKYQRVDLFFKEILDIYAETTDKVTGYKAKGDKAAEIVTFISAVGGAGSSLMAVSFAKYAASREKKVLYLNFELLGSADDYFNGEGRLDFSDVIYAVKSKKANLPIKLESIVKQDSSGVYFYSCTNTALDLLEFDEEDILVYFQELCSEGIYDYIIVDMDCSFDKKAICIMELSGKIILVNNDMSLVNSKLNRFCDVLRILEGQQLTDALAKLFIVYNKSVDGDFKINEVPDIKCLGSVPNFEGETVEALANQMASVEWFKELIKAK